MTNPNNGQFPVAGSGSPVNKFAGPIPNFAEYFDTASNGLWKFVNGAWAQVSGGGGGSGDVTGPAGAVAGNLASFNGVTGKIIQDSGVAAASLVAQTTGNWTPVLQFGGASTGITYTIRPGRYIAIGQLVYVTFVIFLSNKGSATGFATVEGLPFASSSAGQAVAGLNIIGTASNFAAPPVAPYVQVPATATTAITLLQANGTQLSDTDFTNTTLFSASLIYDKGP